MRARTVSRPRGESRGNVRTLGQAGSEPGVWPARHLLPRVTLPTRDRIWKQGFADDVKVKVETRPHRQAGQWPRGGRGGWDHSSSPGAERLGAGSPLPSPPPSLRSGGPVTLGPPTPDSRPPALRTDPRLAGPGRGRWFGWAPRKGDQDGPVWAGPPPSPPPAHLHDRLLLFHVAGAGAWPRLRGRVGSGTLEVAPGSGPTPCSPGTALLPGDRVGWGRGLTARRVCRTRTGVARSTCELRQGLGRSGRPLAGPWPGGHGSALICVRYRGTHT